MPTTSVTLLQRLSGRPTPPDWERFVRLYTPLLLAWGRRSGLSAEDAADLAQDVFVQMVRKLPEFQYDPSRSFRGWLRTVTVNAVRAKARRHAPPAAADPAALAGVPAPDDDDPFWEGEYRAQVSRRALELIQGEFAPSVWKACWETVVGGRPSADVAAELGLTAGGVRSAKLRVLARLRAELGGLLE